MSHGYTQDLGGLPLCTSSFWGCPLCCPVAVVDLNLSSVFLGRRDRFSICAVLSVACSRDQSHKKWVTSSLSFPASRVDLVLFILQYFEGVCVLSRVVFCGRISSGRSHFILLEENAPDRREATSPAPGHPASKLKDWHSNPGLTSSSPCLYFVLF